jgi:imidazolonepropionase-like amidohydrolase
MARRIRRAARRLSHLPRHDANGAWITPGLVDCHTHLVYGGQRADEFAMRLAGASYEEIARAGGGIVSTVRATREADEATLFAQAAARLEPLLAEGVTAIEIKSGYGLSLDAERKQLRVARQLARPMASPSTRRSLAPMRCRPSTPAAPTRTSSWSARRCCRRWLRKGLSMRSTRSVRALASRSRRPRACSRPPRATACRSSSMPSN